MCAHSLHCQSELFALIAVPLSVRVFPDWREQISAPTAFFQVVLPLESAFFLDELLKVQPVLVKLLIAQPLAMLSETLSSTPLADCCGCSFSCGHAIIYIFLALFLFTKLVQKINKWMSAASFAAIYILMNILAICRSGRERRIE